MMGVFSIWMSQALGACAPGSIPLNQENPMQIRSAIQKMDGTIFTNVFARVLVSNKKAAIQCAGRIEVSGTPSGSLEIVYMKKIPKVRISK